MNNEKGKRVFGDDVDSILADKIVKHSKKNSGAAKKSAKAPVKTEKPKPENPKTETPKAEKSVRFTYQTPEHRDRVKGLRKYGFAALALLAALGALSFVLAKFRRD